MKVSSSIRRTTRSTGSKLGFSLVEIVVTLFVATIFLTSIFTLVSNVILFATTTSQRTAASNLAYANLRLYANSTIPSWFACPSPATATVTVLSKTNDVPDLPSGVTQTVVASAPYGCGNGMPIRVESTVTYAGARKVSHATYSGF